MSEKPFADSAQDAALGAQQLAERNRHASIEPEHLLAALVSAKSSPVVSLFDALVEDERPPERCPSCGGGQCCVPVEREEKSKRKEKER